MAARNFLRRQNARSRKIESRLRDVVPPLLTARKDTHPVHTLFSYPAKFQSYLPAELIDQFSTEQTLIVDPFCGGGTTASCALLAGRSSLSVDLNPISVAVTRAKTTRLTPREWSGLQNDLLGLRTPRSIKLLTADESRLMGPDLALFAEAAWRAIVETRKKPSAALFATALIKRIKLACRRDKEHLRTAPFHKHVEYVLGEIRSHFEVVSANDSASNHIVLLQSNHSLPLKDGSRA